MPVLLRSTVAGLRQTVQGRPGRQSTADSLRVPQKKDESRRNSRTSTQSSGEKGSLPKTGTLTRQHSLHSNGEPPEPQSFKQKVTGWLHKAYKRYHLKMLFPLFFIMIYMVIGAVIFLWLEGGADEQKKEEEYYVYRRERELLLRRMEEILGDRAARRRSVRRKFLDEAVDHFEGQVGFGVSNQSIWNMATAMYFSGTLFTTIGYGDVACVTGWGRLLTVIYSCIGVPLMLITLNDLGKFLYSNINGTVRNIENVVAYFTSLVRCNRHKKTPGFTEIEIIDRLECGTIDSLQSEVGSHHSDKELDEEIEHIESKPQMSVKVALFITLGWIFVCAALFRLWEDWTYGESCYFMYISLSTIGLGDISVQRKDMMVLCFVFVIVGLSLVSMTINVVQVAIEDMYMAFLMKMIMDYQEKMAAGGDHMGASVGMMRMWGNNKAAKFLMPLIGKEQRRAALEKVGAEAKEKGFEVPSILTDIDVNSGLPKILHLDEGKDEDAFNTQMEELVQRQLAMEESLAPPLPPPKMTHDADTQTDTVRTIEDTSQTEEKKCDDDSTQTEEAEKTELRGVESQTDVTEQQDEEQQTPAVDSTEEETNTERIATMECDSQCEQVVWMDQEQQTQGSEMEEGETQTEVVMENKRIQTPSPVIEMRSVQTDDLTDERPKSPSKMAAAKKRLRRAFAKKKEPLDRRKSMDNPTMSDWKDIAEEDEEGEEGEGLGPSEDEEADEESLHWDPVDGMHAEKQQPVKKLTAMFEKPSPFAKPEPRGRKRSE